MDVNDIFSAFGDIFGDSDNIFGSMFGNQRQSRRKGGSNLKISIPLTLEEMYSGNYNMAQKIKRIKLELQAARKELENTVNSIEFDFIPLSDMVTEDQKINSIINEAHNRPN